MTKRAHHRYTQIRDTNTGEVSQPLPVPVFIRTNTTILVQWDVFILFIVTSSIISISAARSSPNENMATQPCLVTLLPSFKCGALIFSAQRLLIAPSKLY